MIFLLRGGLGNQLFQICKLATLSASRDVDFYISDLNTFRLQRGLGGTESLFLPIASLFPTNSPPRILNSNSRLLVKFLVALNNRLSVPKVIDERFDKFNNLPLLSLLSGYFQDFNIIDQIQIDSLNRAILLNDSKNKTGEYSNRVCIHIRRKDYPASISDNFGHDYYSKAIAKFQQMGFRQFDCYSDDVYKARQVLSFLPEEMLRFPEINLQLDSISLLRKMAEYENFILSQSSLAWWASYLAFRNNPKVRIEGRLPRSLDFTINIRPNYHSL